jgi:hypothetical protein
MDDVAECTPQTTKQGSVHIHLRALPSHPLHKITILTVYPIYKRRNIIYFAQWRHRWHLAAAVAPVTHLRVVAGGQCITQRPRARAGHSRSLSSSGQAWSQQHFRINRPPVWTEIYSCSIAISSIGSSAVTATVEQEEPALSCRDPPPWLDQRLPPLVARPFIHCYARIAALKGLSEVRVALKHSKLPTFWKVASYNNNDNKGKDFLFIYLLQIYNLLHSLQ